MRTGRIVQRSYRQPRRLVPASATRLRGRSVILMPGQAVTWHSTGKREEILVALAGSPTLEFKPHAEGVTRRHLAAGQCAFLPHALTHRVVNRSQRPAHYLYFTA